MLRMLGEIPEDFQWVLLTSGGSMQHGRDMEPFFGRLRLAPDRSRDHRCGRALAARLSETCAPPSVASDIDALCSTTALLQAQADRDPACAGKDEIDTEEKSQEVDAGDGPMRKDHRAKKKSDEP
jgi:hypothetical protein